MLSTSKKYVSQHSKRTRGKLASKLCHSSTIGVTRSISLVFELWKLELMGGTAVQRGMFVQQQGFQVLLAQFRLKTSCALKYWFRIHSWY